MHKIWEYFKRLGWMLPAGLTGLTGGLTCLAVAFVLTRGEREQTVLKDFGRYSDGVSMLLIFGFALVIAGVVVTVLSRRST